MAAMDTILSIAAMVGGGYIVVAYILPMLQAQAQSQPTQSDIQSFQDWFSGAFADPALKTEDGLLSELALELSEQELIDKLSELVNGEEEDEDSSDDEEDDGNGSSSKKKKKKLTASQKKKADANKTAKSSRTAESNKRDVELFNKTFWKP